MRTFKGFSTVDRQWGTFKSYDLDLAKRDLLNEIYTRKGERLMSPEFGYIVWELLFDPLMPETVDVIKMDTQRIINRDPRFEFRRLDVTEDTDRQTITVVINLNYLPTATVTELVATFYRDLSLNQQQG